MLHPRKKENTWFRYENCANMVNKERFFSVASFQFLLYNHFLHSQSPCSSETLGCLEYNECFKKDHQFSNHIKISELDSPTVLNLLSKSQLFLILDHESLLEGFYDCGL